MTMKEGAFYTGNYRSVFKEYGCPESEITEKVNDTWNKLFIYMFKRLKFISEPRVYQHGLCCVLKKKGGRLVAASIKTFIKSVVHPRVIVPVVCSIFKCNVHTLVAVNRH